MKSKVDVAVLTDENIAARLSLADKILKDMERAGMFPVLPEHLEDERTMLIAEQRRRMTCIGGDNI